ncbi:MAG: PspC domain-containing protein [Chloroflexaceae bacterium]
MQPRLRRSAIESMVAGVCGGLAEYFNIDPAIVRLIFVVVTLTSGLGLPAYLILWVVMPRAPSTSAGKPTGKRARQVALAVEETSRPGTAAVTGERLDQLAQQARSQGIVAVQGSAREHCDPLTRQPSDTEEPADQAVAPVPPAETREHSGRRTARWRTLGLILIGISGLVLLDQFGIDTSFFFPALLIVAGVILLQRQR